MTLSQAHWLRQTGITLSPVDGEMHAMAMNRIQCQPGLSLPDFLRNFGSETQCEQVLEATRWPQGFRCPRCPPLLRCAGEAYCVVRDGTRKMFQCAVFRHQASSIAGTMLQGTKLSMTTWFLAVDLISQAKPDSRRWLVCPGYCVRKMCPHMRQFCVLYLRKPESNRA